jgi:hypothetical protein
MLISVQAQFSGKLFRRFSRIKFHCGLFMIDYKNFSNENEENKIKFQKKLCNMNIKTQFE